MRPYWWWGAAVHPVEQEAAGTGRVEARVHE
jgi:hypothetical protein